MADIYSIKRESLVELADNFRTNWDKKNLSLDEMAGLAAEKKFLVKAITNKMRPSNGLMIVTAEDLYGITNIPDDMFKESNFFNEITFPDTLTTIYSNAFRNCTGLKYVSIPSSVTTFGGTPFVGSSVETIDLYCNVAGDTFYGCTSLSTVKIGSEVSEISGAAFMNCSALSTLIIYGDRICTLGATFTLFGTPIESGTGYIYVPSAFKEQYTNSTNWSDFAAQIRAIEDYPDITEG